MAGVVAYQRANASLMSVPMPEELVEIAQERMLKMSVDGFVEASLAGPRWRGTIDRAATISTPTLVIYGELDVTPIVLASQWLGQTIPGARTEVIPGSGHSPQMEKADLFNRVLRRHLEESHG